jgi:sugar/nucleoside kinase (ribokinase family)
VPPPAPVVDSNGAGDAFAAAFLYGRLTGEPPHRCALYGAVAGAYACTVPSTQAAAIDRAGLLARVGEQEPAPANR